MNASMQVKYTTPCKHRQYFHVILWAYCCTALWNPTQGCNAVDECQGVFPRAGNNLEIKSYLRQEWVITKLIMVPVTTLEPGGTESKVRQCDTGVNNALGLGLLQIPFNYGVSWMSVGQLLALSPGYSQFFVMEIKWENPMPHVSCSEPWRDRYKSN